MIAVDKSAVFCAALFAEAGRTYCLFGVCLKIYRMRNRPMSWFSVLA